VSFVGGRRPWQGYGNRRPLKLRWMAPERTAFELHRGKCAALRETVTKFCGTDFPIGGFQALHHSETRLCPGLSFVNPLTNSRHQDNFFRRPLAPTLSPLHKYYFSPISSKIRWEGSVYPRLFLKFNLLI